MSSRSVPVPERALSGDIAPQLWPLPLGEAAPLLGPLTAGATRLRTFEIGDLIGKLSGRVAPSRFAADLAGVSFQAGAHVALCSRTGLVRAACSDPPGEAAASPSRTARSGEKP
jgi:hypothetical protein